MSKSKKTHTTKGLRPPKSHSSKHAAKIYWPYIPFLVLLFSVMIISAIRPFNNAINGRTMAYATEMSRENLLASTNNRRASNGISNLTLNSSLSQAAQNKATDMRNRDYWSHNTPDGQEPWIFIDEVGYAYTKAGENLAFGFPTSDATVTGWMNSPSHRANMLDSTFTEVGFGFINSENFVSSGNQTIVVAMYAKPYTKPTATAPTLELEVQFEELSETSPDINNPQEQSQTVPIQKQNDQTEIKPEQQDSIIEDTIIANTAEPITTESSDKQLDLAEPVRATLLTDITSGNYLWATTAVSLIGFSLSFLWIIKHGVAVRKIIVTGEHFVAHHPVFDLIVISLVVLAIYLTQGSGVVL